MLLPKEGFCYAVTPGNDVRAVAMVAANLCCLGLPFIVKASREDAVAPLIVRALVAGGFDPHFCNLVYFDVTAPDAPAKHFKMVDACAVIWTFGSDDTVDRALRYERKGAGTYVDISDLIDGFEPDYPLLWATIARSPLSLQGRIQVKQNITDHFEGKSVLRHGSGNCAMIAGGTFGDATADLIYQSLGYAIGCNAVKSAMVIGDSHWVVHARSFLSGLVTGDPLDARTQVGYANPATLDYLEKQVRTLGARVETWGGERLSPHQASPWLICAREYIDEFFGQEIPAYVLAVGICRTVEEAVERLNLGVRKYRRLAVSLTGIDRTEIHSVVSKIKAHSLFMDAPTITMLPYYHEGNDYALRLSREMLLFSPRSVESNLARIVRAARARLFG